MIVFGIQEVATSRGTPLYTYAAAYEEFKPTLWKHNIGEQLLLFLFQNNMHCLITLLRYNAQLFGIYSKPAVFVDFSQTWVARTPPRASL